MKKTKLLAVILCLATLVSVLNACSADIKPQTADGFSEIMTAKGFEVHDVTLGIDPTVVSQTFALNEEYQVEFYVLTDADTCRDTFDGIKQDLKSKNPVQTLSTDVSTDDYSYFDFNADESYYVMARIGSTLVYCTADKEHRDEIIGIIKALGYK